MSDTGGSYDPDAPISVLGNAGLDPNGGATPMPSAPTDPAPGVLGGISLKPWTPADNSLNFFVDPATMKTIDFGGDAAPDGGSTPQGEILTYPPQPIDGGFNGLTPWQPGADAGSSVLNKHGYIPQDGDENQLARIIYAEASNTPSDMPAIGWSVVNRVGDPEFGKTMDDVINQKNAFSSVQGNSKQWQGSADPGSLAGPNAAAWQKAQDTAQGIVGGAIPDPVDGGTYFFAWPKYNGDASTAPGDYQRMLGNGLITPVSPIGGGSGKNYFFKRNPS